MSYSNPKASGVKSPATVFFKLDSRREENPMYLTFKKKDDGTQAEQLEVTAINMAILDEDFLTVTGQAPDGLYLSSNTVHWGGNKVLKVNVRDENGKVDRHVATGEWKTISKTVKASGGRNTKVVYALLLSVEGPDAARVSQVNAHLQKFSTIIKFDIKGSYWGAYLETNKRLKVSNWSQMLIRFARPLVPHKHKFGTSWLPAMGGRKVDPKKDVAIDEACRLLDSTVLKEYRDYIKQDSVRDEDYEASPEDFAAENGISDDFESESSNTAPPPPPSLPEDDLPF